MKNDLSLPSPEQIETWQNEFISLCGRQINKGAEYEEPGEEPGWIKNDLFLFLYEELADLTNYSMFIFCRLRMLEEHLFNEFGVSLKPPTPAKSDFLPGAPYGFTPDHSEDLQ